MSKDQRIICICNYGQVRSVTMANTLRRRGYKNSLAMGMMVTPPWIMEKFIGGNDLTIICNKPNVENGLQPDIPPEYAKQHLAVLDLHKDKIITCDTIGLDRWGKPDHPALVPICEEYVSKLESDGLLIQ